MFLDAVLFPVKFSKVKLVIAPSIFEIVRSFPSILFLTLLACEEIYETSVITVQVRANFKVFSSHSTSKCISISHIITNLTKNYSKFFRCYFTVEWV